MSTTIDESTSVSEPQSPPETPLEVVARILGRVETARRKKADHAKWLREFHRDQKLVVDALQGCAQHALSAAQLGRPLDLTMWVPHVLDAAQRLQQRGWGDLVASQSTRTETSAILGLALLEAAVRGATFAELTNALRGKQLPDDYSWQHVFSDLAEQFGRRRAIEERTLFAECLPQAI